MRESLRRRLLPWLGRQFGEVRAAQQMRQFREAARLSAVFGVTMVLPIGFLAVLSLSSIRSEELSFDADLRQRASATTAHLHGEMEGIFERFELATRERLRRGESPTSNLGELSPFLRAAFRFDHDGRLAAPFELPTTYEQAMAPVGFERAASNARSLESRHAIEALAAWRSIRQRMSRPSALGEAMLGEARALSALGRSTEAEVVLRQLYADLAQERDQRGFRLGDLAMLQLSSDRIKRGDVDGATGVLVDLVDQLLTLNPPWTVGLEGEAAVVREALRRLEGHRDLDWLARSRSRLNELYAQQSWALVIRDEIELVHSRIPDGEVRYVGARIDSPAVWALVRDGDNTYAFSFSVQALFADLKATVARRDALDPDLRSALFLPDEPLPENPLSTRALGPWIPVVTLAVEPKDPDALARSKNRRRSIRIAIVFTAVSTALVGALWLARMIATEVDAARQRADFAANVSHELRSPITQIRLKGEALQLGLVDPGDDMQRHFDAIVRESERLSRLVDNVLDFAAIERGAKRYHLRPDDLVEIVAAGVHAAESALEEAGFELMVDLQEDLPRVWVDREAVGQVVTNLLSNALKYGVEGKWVRVRLHQVGVVAELSVADRGIGIRAEEVGRVFEDFFRSTDPMVRRTKGTGIGLAIVRYIVEAHGGTITVESAPQRGARFIVRLPLREPDAAKERY